MPLALRVALKRARAALTLVVGGTQEREGDCSLTHGVLVDGCSRGKRLTRQDILTESPGQRGKVW